MIMKRILVPVDFSADSLHALAYARDLARHFRAEVVLVQVVEPTYLADGSNLYVPDPELATLVDDQWRMGNAELARLQAGLEQTGLNVRIIVASGVAARMIVDMAKHSGAQLIVMGTHGRSGLRHLLVGSVAEKVVRTASCPVLTVRRALAAPPALQPRAPRSGAAPKHPAAQGATRGGQPQPRRRRRPINSTR